MQTKRRMTKSPLRLAETALATARQALPPYSSKFSRKDQPFEGGGESW